MYKRLRYEIVLVMLVFSITKASAQIAMPDTVCIGTNRIYQVNNTAVPSAYTWKIDGKTQQATKNTINITWNNAGTFLLTVQEHRLSGCDGDTRSGLVYVKPLPVPNAGPDAILCFGTTFQLKGSGGTLYQWTPPANLSNPNIANPFVNTSVQGVFTYLLSATDAFGCKALQQDTVNLTVLPQAKVFAGRDTFVAINQLLQLNALDVNNSGFTKYTWSPPFGLNNPGIKDPALIAIKNITYNVTATTANGCTATDDIKLVVFTAADIYVPNAFTPNGDGVNDVLRPILVGIKELKFFAVYNRYGQQVYLTSLQGAGWNGMVQGLMQNTGGFVWTAEAVDFNGNTIKRNGMAVLIK